MSRPEDFVIKDGVLRQYRGYQHSHIVIPDGVKAIGPNCFYSCCIPSIRIPDSVISIDRGAFCGCSELETIIIPDNVISIGAQAFYGCCDLTWVKLPANLTRVGREAFKNCKKLTAITIPDGVKSIGENAFLACTRLVSINIPDSVTSIGPGAFAFCENLKPVEIPETLKSIGTRAFFKCDKFADKDGFVVANNVLYSCSKREAHITIPDGVEMISGGAFYTDMAKDLVSVTIPDSVKVIGELAFGNCENLVTVTIPANLKLINYDAFKNCSSLKNIILPQKVKEFEGTAFEVVWKYFSDNDKKILLLCSFLEQLDDLAVNRDEIESKIKANKKLLVDYAIQNDDADIMAKLFSIFKKFELDALDAYIKQAESAQNVTAFLLEYKNRNYSAEKQEQHENDKLDKELGFKERTLTEWRKIFNFITVGNGAIITGYKGTETNVMIPDTIGKYRVVAIGERAFSPAAPRIQQNVKALRKKIQSIVIPGCVRSIGDEAFYGCDSLTTIIVNDDNKAYFTRDGVLFDKYKTVLLHYPTAKQEASYEVPESVIKIGEKAFAWNQHITQVLLPNGTKYIGDGAFTGCIQLVSVIMPDSLRSIGEGAFKFCAKLTSVVLPKNLEVIGVEAFRKCIGLSAMVIPRSVRRIGAFAFCSCTNLLSVKIFEGVTYMGNYAFSDCRKLTIYAPKGSFAAEYARNNRIDFRFR